MKAISIPMPWGGRMHLAFEKNGAVHTRGLHFGTDVRARHIRPEAREVLEKALQLPLERINFGSLEARPRKLVRDLERLHLIDDHRLGSGLVTNVGAMALANEAITLAAPSGARINTLFLANQHVSGKGTTSATALDYKIETISTNGGQTAVAGAQSFQNTMAVPKYQTVATISYTGAEAVTEWGLMTNATLSSTTGSPFTAATATSFTGTSTPYTASSSTVQGLQQQIVIPGTTTVMGLIASNTTSVATLTNNGSTGWFTQAAMTAGSTPGNTETYTLRPIMWDHKVFSAINVVNGDSIQFTYSLTITSGG